MIVIPLRTGTGLNDRHHWRVKAKRVKKEREATAWALAGKQPPVMPCTVLLTRVGPSNGLDDDNLRGSLKAVRDQVAAWLGVDDRSPLVKWEYGQRRTREWGVEVVAGQPSRSVQPCNECGGLGFTQRAA